MEQNAKKHRERQIFDMVYSDRQLHSVEPNERPDFLVQRQTSEPLFGVEIVEFFVSESDARLSRIPGYSADLYCGKGFKHKKDKQSIQVTTIDLIDQDGQVRASDMPAIIQEMPAIASCAVLMANQIRTKTAKLTAACSQLSHVNLIIRDQTRLLAGARPDEFSRKYLVPDLKSAIAQASFREIHFVTEMDGQLGSVPLKLLFGLSELFYFIEQRTEHSESDVVTNNSSTMADFAAYLQDLVTDSVFVRPCDTGTEVIYGDTGFVLKCDHSLELHMYSDHPLPRNCSRPSSRLSTSQLGAIRERIAALRNRSAFVSSIWIPIGSGSVSQNSRQYRESTRPQVSP